MDGRMKERRDGGTIGPRNGWTDRWEDGRPIYISVGEIASISFYLIFCLFDIFRRICWKR